MSLNYSTDGVKPKDYRVYLGLASTSGLQALIATYIGTGGQTKANLDASGKIINTTGSGDAGLLLELGECRADSIDLGIADGDSIEGNVLGKIVLGKSGTFAVELINATPANIAALEELDGNSCTILLNERDTHGDDLKTAILLNNVVVSYGEKITGGDSIRATLNVEKSVPTASSFRHIADIDQTP